jgi:hypothetical protein
MLFTCFGGVSEEVDTKFTILEGYKLKKKTFFEKIIFISKNSKESQINGKLFN